jgi:uncharacterized protein
MKRVAFDQLLDWKNSPDRKPLLLQGARQVGKTYIINEFGKIAYKDFVHLNFEKIPSYSTIFANGLIPEKIIENINLLLGRKIVAENTLIFFDEIQACPEGLTSLKYFCEDAPEVHIIAAGSLLGVSIGTSGSFPVGKVNFLTLYPMSFAEYLVATGNELLAEKLQTPENLAEALHDKANDLLKMYFLIGGMPEVVADYLKNKDIKRVRKIQKDILAAYQRDFSKYTDPGQAIKVAEVWDSIPYQLAKENKKFKYNDVKHKARASHYEQSIEWLKNAGLVHIVCQIRAAKLPIAGYADHEKFKIYLLDTGLLGAMLNLSSDIILQPTQLFLEYNGAFVENYTCLELKKVQENKLYYWTSDADAEVDFVFQHENDIYPLEAKSGTNRNTKSLKSYADKFAPKLQLRASPRNFVQVGEFINLPLYGLLGLRAVLKG